MVMVDVGDIYTGRDEEWKKDDCGAGCLVISGMMRGSSTRGGLYIYLAVLSTSAVVLVEHRLASVGPQLQAFACTLGYEMRARAFLNLVRFGATLAGVLSPTAVL